MLKHEQAERTREAILDAAAQAFEQRGVEATRIQDFLDLAGATKGGMYYHWATKLEVAQELTAQGSARWAQLLTETAQDRRGLEAIHALWHAIALALHDSVRMRAYLKIVAEITTAERSPFEMLQEEFVARLQQAIADGVVSDRINTRQTSISLIDSVYGVLASPAPWNRDANLEQRLAQMWTLIAPSLKTL